MCIRDSDNYTVNKASGKIVEKNVNAQDIKLVRKATGDCEEVDVPAAEQNQQKLTDAQIEELAGYAKKIEAHYGCYMDMEWGVDERDGKIWILQACLLYTSCNDFYSERVFFYIILRNLT